MAFASSSDLTFNHSRFFDNSITHITNNETRNQNVDGLQRFLNAISPDASFDSGARYPPPQCDENTRTALMAHIMHWIDSGEEDILFLDGSAGVGKSAVAQTVAANCAEQKILAGSYFFFRGSSTRNTIAPFIPTITYHITSSTAQARKELGRTVTRDPFILDKSPEVQLKQLILDPHQKSQLLRGCGKRPILIIDGLDECRNDNDQRLVIKLIGQLASKQHTMVRCLLASRPEPQILSAVNSLPANITVTRVTLDEDSWNAGGDIRTYLRSHFDQISLKLPPSIPRPWPSDDVLETLVAKSGGIFIYAATVVKYIDDENALPTMQLEHVLNLTPGTTPFAEVDMLYQEILMTCPLAHREMLLHILGLILLQYPLWDPEVSTIETLLDLPPGEVTFALQRMHSILTITTSGSSRLIRFLHASFRDFIFDKERSGPFFIDYEKENLFITHKCLDYMDHYRGERDMHSMEDKAMEYAWQSWLHHSVDAGRPYFVDVVLKLHHNKSLLAFAFHNMMGTVDLPGFSRCIDYLRKHMATMPVHLLPQGFHRTIEKLSRKLCVIGMLGENAPTVLGVFDNPGTEFFVLKINHIVALEPAGDSPIYLYFGTSMHTHDLGWWDASNYLILSKEHKHSWDKDKQAFVAVHCLHWLGEFPSSGRHYATKYWAKHISLSNNTDYKFLEILRETKLQKVKPSQRIALADVAMVVHWLEGNSALKWQEPELLSLWADHHQELESDSNLGLCLTERGQKISWDFNNPSLPHWNFPEPDLDFID